jgi:hypothetical protein
MPDQTSETIYDETHARFIVAVAVAREQCADLLNTLANGGAVTFDPTLDRLVFIDAQRIAWLASGGRDGHA